MLSSTCDFFDVSDSISVKINCFYSEVFKLEDDGELDFVDGNFEQFEVDGIGVFEGATKEMVQKGITGKMWYKLPYKDISEKTPLFDNNKAHCLELPCPIAYRCFLYPVSSLFLRLDFSVTNQFFSYEP